MPILTTILPHCHMASPNSFLHTIHSSLQQKHVNTFIQVPLCSTFFQTMCSLTQFFFISFLLLPILLITLFYFFLTPSHYRTSLFPSLPVFVIYFSQNNCLRNQISTYLIQFPWQYGFDTLKFIILAPLTPFATHRLAMPLFPVFCDLLSSNDTGFHTIGLLLSFDSWF